MDHIIVLGEAPPSAQNAGFHLVTRSHHASIHTLDEVCCLQRSSKNIRRFGSMGRGSMGWGHVHVGADNRPSAEKLCADLRGAGVSYCEVQRARSTR